MAAFGEQLPARYGEPGFRLAPQNVPQCVPEPIRSRCSGQLSGIAARSEPREFEDSAVNLSGIKCAVGQAQAAFRGLLELQDAAQVSYSLGDPLLVLDESKSDEALSPWAEAHSW